MAGAVTRSHLADGRVVGWYGAPGTVVDAEITRRRPAPDLVARFGAEPTSSGPLDPRRSAPRSWPTSRCRSGCVRHGLGIRPGTRGDARRPVARDHRQHRTTRRRSAREPEASRVECEAGHRSVPFSAVTTSPRTVEVHESLSSPVPTSGLERKAMSSDGPNRGCRRRSCRRRSVRGTPRAGHEIVAAAGDSAASLHRIETLLPGVADAQAHRRRACLRPAAADRPRRHARERRHPARRRRRDPRGPGRLPHLGPPRPRRARLPPPPIGARPIAMHPAMTFTGTELDLDRLDGLRLRHDRRRRASASTPRAWSPTSAASRCGCPRSKRTLYHAGLAHGANHLVTLVSQAMELLAASGAEDPAATLRPLLSAALDNALAQGDAALTGPIVRGDVQDRPGPPARHRRERPGHHPVVRRDGEGHRRPGRARRPAAADPGRPHRRRCSTTRWCASARAGPGAAPVVTARSDLR